jgi:alkylation response protein AidB-like acyl-CoA dehydrogenase
MIEPLPLTFIPAEDEALRAPVRAFLDEKLRGIPLETRARSWMGFDVEFSRALAHRGWVGLTLPPQYGGGGRSYFARFVLAEELLANCAPVSAHWIAERQSAPQILRYGAEAQKQFYVPRICRAEIFFCIGMSEPQAGSDLAAVRSRATRTSNGWRLNGQKIWTTNAYRANYMIALVRTSGAAEDRHKGLSQFIVDLSLPGVTVRPIEDLTGDKHFCEVFFENVDLADDALIGAEGAGWEQVTAELAFERSGPERLYSSMALFDAWLAFVRETKPADDTTRRFAGRIAAHLAVLRAMSISVTAQLAQGKSPVVEAALVKDMGTEIEQLIPAAIVDLLAAEPDCPAPASLARALSYVMHISPSFSLRGGTREILRGVIARGMGLR